MNHVTSRRMVLRITIVAAVLLFPAMAFAQTKLKQAPANATPHVTASPAFAETLLRRTELEADLEALLLDYTEEFPKVKEIRQSLEYLNRETGRLATVKLADASKLTLALGKLIVRKVELETDVWGLLRSYKEDHPDVKRARRRVDIYEAAIKQILN